MFRFSMLHCFPYRRQFFNTAPLLSGLMVALFAALVGLFGLMNLAHATDLPAGVIQYLKANDPSVNIRFDGVVTLANGEVYLPVFPQRPANAAGAQPLPDTPKIGTTPNLIPFSQNMFLIRVVRTTTGKLALANTDYPIALKEGMLPQDMLLPSALYIPAELKVILGNLPYQPMNEPTGAIMSAASAFKPAQTATTSSNGPSTSGTLRTAAALPSDTVYFTRVDTKKLVRGQLKQTSANSAPTLKSVDEMALGCLPLNLHTSHDRSHLFVPCLNTNEVVIVDTETQTVQTRLAVASPIAYSLALPDDTLLLTHRTSNLITRLHMGKRQLLGSINPNMRGYAMTHDATNVYIADISKPSVLVWDIKSNTAKTHLPALLNTSALNVSTVNDTPVLWAASRNLNQVAAINLATGKLLRTLNVGSKPVGLASHPSHKNRLWVISGGDHQLNHVDGDGVVSVWASLPKGSFPTQITFVNNASQLLITAAGGQQAFIATITDTAPATTTAIALPGRSNAILVAQPAKLMVPAATPAYTAEPMTKPATKPVSKPAAKTVARPNAKPAYKPAVKPGAKPAAKK